MQLLVSNGADLGKADAEGLTPIHQASRTGRVHILQWLLDQSPYYLPASYPPRRAHARADAHDGDALAHEHAYAGDAARSSFAWLLAWLSPAAEVTASLVCCLPVWQACSASEDYRRVPSRS